MPGCMDVMLGYGKEEPFFRLYYPTDAKKGAEVNHFKIVSGFAEYENVFFLS